MSGALRVVLYALGALALLVVVNWARQELVVGLVAACLVVVAVTVLSRGKKTRDGGTSTDGEASEPRSSRAPRERPRAGSVES